MKGFCIYGSKRKEIRTYNNYTIHGFVIKMWNLELAAIFAQMPGQYGADTESRR